MTDLIREIHDGEEVPLSELVSADVERMDGVLGPTNGIPFLLMRAEEAPEQVDLLDLFLRAKQLQRSDKASGTKKQRASSKHKLVVNGEVKFPINDCSDVEDAWGLRGHATGVSQDRVESYIKSAAKAEGCPIPGAVKRQSPGDPDWEATDVSLGQQALSLIQQAKQVVQTAATREQLEAAFAGETSYEDANVLMAALAALTDALAAVGSFVSEETEEAEGEGYERTVARVGKTISAATGAKIRAALEALQSLLSDANQTADLPEGVEMADDDVKRAKKKAQDADGDNDGDEPTEEEVERAREVIAKYERAQAPKVGSMNKPAMAGSQPGGDGGVQSLMPENGGAGVENLTQPGAGLKNAEGAVNSAVGDTAANLKLATSEEESPDIGEVIARSIQNGLKDALAEGLRPLQETLEKIAKEDSKSQRRPLVRGADQDYHLRRTGDGRIELAGGPEELNRALDQLDPATRDIVTRQLATNAHPLLAGKDGQ